MRGTRAWCPRWPRSTGIIPAYAGNTLRRYQHFDTGRDHPRICGEHRVPGGDQLITPGSSPHMRGTRTCRFPAPPRWGSSPHMRGTPLCVKSACRVTGIIPAYAGNTRLRCRRGAAHRDHPRICGEHYSHSLHSERVAGSSPHMRGTPYPRAVMLSMNGIIPAYAGNTGLEVALESAIVGSSPHMRGTPDSYQNVLITGGIIPAYAGNTFARPDELVLFWDHPRICGEHGSPA